MVMIRTSPRITLPFGNMISVWSALFVRLKKMGKRQQHRWQLQYYHWVFWVWRPQLLFSSCPRWQQPFAWSPCICKGRTVIVLSSHNLQDVECVQIDGCVFYTTPRLASEASDGECGTSRPPPDNVHHKISDSLDESSTLMVCHPPTAHTYSTCMCMILYKHWPICFSYTRFAWFCWAYHSDETMMCEVWFTHI